MQPDIGPVCRLHLEFMKWADDIMLAALSQVSSDRLNLDLGNSFQSLLGTINHVYLWELAWLRRVQGNPAARAADFESPADLGTLEQAWPALHQEWIDWSRSTGAWQEPSMQRSLKGVEFQMPLWQIVMHVVNHGSYHRGQVATMLRQSGITPPGTDLITFYRTR